MCRKELEGGNNRLVTKGESSVTGGYLLVRRIVGEYRVGQEVCCAESVDDEAQTCTVDRQSLQRAKNGLSAAKS